MTPTSPAARLSLIVLGLACFGCATVPRSVETSEKPGPNHSFRLLGAVLEKETARFTQRRQDLEVDLQSGDRTPHVVATGQTPQMLLQGHRARLYGDANGTQGWFVDNFVLLEVFSGDKLYSTAVVGFPEGGVLLGKERLDNLGKMGFTFEPGEVDLSDKLPESEPFTVRATALDYGGVGKVSDLYLVFESHRSATAPSDDLKAQ